MDNRGLFFLALGHDSKTNTIAALKSSTKRDSDRFLLVFLEFEQDSLCRLFPNRLLLCGRELITKRRPPKED